MEDPELQEIIYYIHDAFMNKDFEYFFDVIDYYNENYNEDVIFHILELVMNQITNEQNDEDSIHRFNELLNYLLKEIDINRVSDSGYTPASIMITVIFKNIRGRWGADPEDYFQFIDSFFKQYVDLDAGNPSINELLKHEPDDNDNTIWCKDQIKEMIDFKKSETMKQGQALSLTSALNPTSGVDSSVNYIDLDTLSKLYGYLETPKPEIYDKSDKEYKFDPLLKSKQKLSFAKGFTDPKSHIQIEDHFKKEDIGRLISSLRPYPSVQERMMIEDKPKTKKTRKFAKRSIKNRNKNKGRKQSKKKSKKKSRKRSRKKGNKN
tara:strand:- start:819 stop:1781 length:963 start_codon:yes stop_codon:yes gene_type:complete